MYVDPAELQLKRQLEQALGRTVSDIEWESFKVASLAPAEGFATTFPAREWAGKKRALFLAALLGLLAGVGLLLRAGFMFSPYIAIPLGVCLWLLTLVLIRLWLEGLSEATGCLSLLGWIWVGIFVLGLFFLIPFSVGGWELLSGDRHSLTSLGGWTVKEYTPAGYLGVALIIVAVFIGWASAPTKSESL